MSMKKNYDVFISYASEDKKVIASPLAEELKRNGIRVWFDEFEIMPGDGLRRSIEIGMGNSKYGIVILSDNFFHKEWTNYELDGLVAMNMASPGSLLPIWYRISKEVVSKYSLPLSNILAVNASNMTIPQIVQNLLPKLGEYHYSVDKNENIVRSLSKIIIPISDRESGYQVIKSINTDEIINNTTCVCTNEALIYPYENICEYKFNYWQARKGELNVITHMAYDCNTGKVISDGNKIVQNDGCRLLSIVHFNRITDGPIRIICKISATNLHSGLFTDGFSDMGFNHGRNLEYFAYYLVMPDKNDYKHIRLFAENEECKIINTVGKKEIGHMLWHVQGQTETKYRIINEAIK